MRHLPSSRAARQIIALALLAAGSSAIQATSFQDTLAQRLQACTVCHGAEGRAGPDGYYPRLAGKPAGYLYQQMLNFREGRRHYAPMTHLLAPLPQAYLREIADYFARQDLPYPAPVRDSAGSSATLLARGQQLATQGDPARQLPACSQCHGKALTGVSPGLPGLLGLPRDYLNSQLGAWRQGQRRAQTPDCMAEVTRRLHPDDIAAVSLWLSRQPVPTPSRPATTLAAKLPLSCGAVDSGEATR